MDAEKLSFEQSKKKTKFIWATVFDWLVYLEDLQIGIPDDVP